MEQPIIYPLKQPWNLDDDLTNAVENDDKDEFLRIINDPRFGELERFAADTIFEYDAIKIGIAVLNGETRGIIDLEVFFVNGWTPLHYAASMGAPKLTKYLIERGDHVDGYLNLNLKQITPVELTLEKIEYELGDHEFPWTPLRSIFKMLCYVCEYQRSRLEAVRLLLQNTQNTDRVRKAFLDYADEGKLAQLAALFLAAPELFLSSHFKSLGGGMSSIDMLYLLLNSSEKRTDIQDALSLLLDVFCLVGHKLIAYIRVDDPKVLKLHAKFEHLKFGFFIREVAHKKLGISSPDDYLLSFFKPVRQGSYDLDCIPRWLMVGRGADYPINYKDIDYIKRTFFSLNHKEAAVMNTAIEKKLSTMPNLRYLYEGMIRIPKTWEKQRFSFPCVRSFQPSVRFFSTKETNAKHRFYFKVTPTNGWESRVMQVTKLKSFFSAARLSHFPMIAKRLIK